MESKHNSSEKSTADDADNEYEFKHIWLRDQMRLKIPEYSIGQKLKILCGTWNVNDKVFQAPVSSSSDRKSPVPEEKSGGNLKDWLLPSISSSTESANTTSEDNMSEPSVEEDVSTSSRSNSAMPTFGLTDERPHIYIIGFQEMVDLTPVNVVISNQKILERLAYWKHEVEESINASDYCLLVEKHLVGLLLLIYVRRPLINRIRDIRAVILPTGVLGIMGKE